MAILTNIVSTNKGLVGRTQDGREINLSVPEPTSLTFEDNGLVPLEILEKGIDYAVSQLESVPNYFYQIGGKCHHEGIERKRVTVSLNIYTERK